MFQNLEEHDLRFPDKQLLPKVLTEFGDLCIKITEDIKKGSIDMSMCSIRVSTAMLVLLIIHGEARKSSPNLSTRQRGGYRADALRVKCATDTDAAAEHDSIGRGAVVLNQSSRHARRGTISIALRKV